MIKVSNEKIKEHLNSLDESSKTELVALLSENKEDLKSNFSLLKEDTITKLENIKNSEKDLNLGKKLEETINKVSNEKFDILNYYMLKKLNQSLI
jgi:hypothetical protein